MKIRIRTALILIIALPFTVWCQSGPTRAPDIHYVPTPEKVVERMLELAEIKEGDLVYDLGSGDGRIVIAAAQKYGVRAVGFDIDPERVREARENVRKAGVGHLVTIEHADIFTLDLSKADVITLYLLPRLNVQLMPQLRKMREGSRIVSHDFNMRGARPVQVEQMRISHGDWHRDHWIYFWRVPWLDEEPEQ